MGKEKKKKEITKEIEERTRKNRKAEIAILTISFLFFTSLIFFFYLRPHIFEGTFDRFTRERFFITINSSHQVKLFF